MVLECLKLGLILGYDRCIHVNVRYGIAACVGENPAVHGQAVLNPVLLGKLFLSCHELPFITLPSLDKGKQVERCAVLIVIGREVPGGIVDVSPQVR